VNGKTDAGDSPDNLTQRLLAHVPLLLHREAKDVLVIGLGSGVTLGSALRHPIARADIVEISPEVVEASRFFEAANGRALADPRSAEAQHVLGRAFLTRNGFDRAQAAFREAVRLRPDFAEAYNDLGGTLVRLERADEALAAFRRAADAGYGPALYNLGNLYLRVTRDPARAREVLERAVKLEQATADTWNALGVAYAQQGEYERARGAGEQALRLDPAHAGAHRNREKLDKALIRPGSPAPVSPFLD